MFTILVVMMDETSALQEEKRKCGHAAMDSDSQLLNLRSDDETIHPLKDAQLEETSFDTGQYCVLHRMLVVYVCVHDRLKIFHQCVVGVFLFFFCLQLQVSVPLVSLQQSFSNIGGQ